jgi:hypothetical protein
VRSKYVTCLSVRISVCKSLAICDSVERNLTVCVWRKFERKRLCALPLTLSLSNTHTHTHSVSHTLSSSSYPLEISLSSVCGVKCFKGNASVLLPLMAQPLPLSLSHTHTFSPSLLFPTENAFDSFLLLYCYKSFPLGFSVVVLLLTAVSSRLPLSLLVSFIVRIAIARCVSPSPLHLSLF